MVLIPPSFNARSDVLRSAPTGSPGPVAVGLVSSSCSCSWGGLQFGVGGVGTAVDEGQLPGPWVA